MNKTRVSAQAAVGRLVVSSLSNDNMFR